MLPFIFFFVQVAVIDATKSGSLDLLLKRIGIIQQTGQRLRLEEHLYYSRIKLHKAFNKLKCYGCAVFIGFCFVHEFAKVR